jgi:hypothetical protein
MVIKPSPGLEAGQNYNLVKFHLNEFKLSFLSYPDFFDDPHPVLSQSLTVHLAFRAPNSRYSNVICS